MITSNSISRLDNQNHNNTGFGVDAYLIENAFLSVEETARLFREDEMFVISLIKSKILTARRIADSTKVSILIDSSSIQQYLYNSIVTDDDLDAYVAQLDTNNHHSEESLSPTISRTSNGGNVANHSVSVTPINLHKEAPNAECSSKNNEKITHLKLKNDSTPKDVNVISDNSSLSTLACLTPSTADDIIQEATDEDISPDIKLPNNSIAPYKDTVRLTKYISNLTSGTKTVPGCNELKVSWHKNFKRVFILTNGVKIQLIKFLIGQEISAQDISNIQKYYERFLYLKAEKMPCNEIGLLRNDSKRKLITFNDFWDFAEETLNKDSVIKVVRMRKRYFSGELGNKKLAAFDYNSFKKYFLDEKNENRVKTDRDTVIKLFSAVYNKATESANLTKLDFPNFVLRQKRNRSDSSSKEMIELETYISHIEMAVQLGFDQLALNLILQEAVSTRKKITTHQKWSDINFESLVKEVAAHENKNGKYGRLLLPEQLKELLTIYRDKLKADLCVEKDTYGMPIHLFPSPQEANAHKPRANFDGQLKTVKAAIKNKIETSDAEKHDKSILSKKIDKFSVHRLRDLTDALLLEVGATEAQKEKAAGRSTKEVATAYEDLTDRKIIELKTKKFNLIASRHPRYQDAIDILKSEWDKDAKSS